MWHVFFWFVTFILHPLTFESFWSDINGGITGTSVLNGRDETEILHLLVWKYAVVIMQRIFLKTVTHVNRSCSVLRNFPRASGEGSVSLIQRTSPLIVLALHYDQHLSHVCGWGVGVDPYLVINIWMILRGRMRGRWWWWWPISGKELPPSQASGQGRLLPSNLACSLSCN